MSIIDLSIIIVSYNTCDLLQNCLESIEQHLSGVTYEIIVIDNNSRDNSQEWLNQYVQNRTSTVKIICSDINLGFGKANNAGLKIAQGKYVLFLNSDTFLIENSAIESIVNWMESDTACFGAGCLLLNPDQSYGVSYGQFPEFKTVFKEIITNRYCKLRAITPTEENVIKKIDFPCGAFFVVKKELLDKVGFFDEQFFLYFEETDLAKRAIKSGYNIYYYGFSKIVHIGGASQSRRSEFITTMNFTSWSKYLLKHKGKIESFLIMLLLKTFFYTKIVYAIILKKKNVYHHFKEELSGLKKGWIL